MEMFFYILGLHVVMCKKKKPSTILKKVMKLPQFLKDGKVLFNFLVLFYYVCNLEILGFTETRKLVQ